LDKLSDICADVAQVILGTVVVPVALDRSNAILLLFGGGVCFVFWLLSIRLMKND